MFSTSSHATRLPSLRAAAEASDVIICGDFNSLEQDSPCWLLRQGRLERNHTDACCPQVGGRGVRVLWMQHCYCVAMNCT
jgi:hypothetical protein